MAPRTGAGLWLAVVSVCLIVALSQGELEDEIDWENAERQEWVDPTDMLDYDMGTQSMKKPPTKHPHKQVTGKIKQPYGAGKLSHQKKQKPKAPNLIQRPFGAGKISQRQGNKNIIKQPPVKEQRTDKHGVSDTKRSDNNADRTPDSKTVQPGEKEGVVRPKAQGIKQQQGMRRTVVKTEHQPTQDTGGVEIADVASHAKVNMLKVTWVSNWLHT